jgi:DNA helicase II / ATP-dependent DNA helicase PcrA
MIVDIFQRYEMTDIIQDYIDNLNPSQKSAATLGNGASLILAAAGSGKTSTLTCRIAHLIEHKKIQPHNILAVTFTNKAAREMSTRLQKMGINTYPLWIGTFHGICNKILRAHAQDAGLQKNFNIMDQQEQLSFIKRMLRANNYDPKNLNVTDLQDKINGYKEVGWRANQLRINTQERKFYELYEQACIRDNCVDFGELLFGCYELFQNHPEIADGYAEKFQHILIDEFQDTSELQYKWIKILASKHGNIFAVGDDDQCFAKGEKVLMFDGVEKNIEDIQVGDKVFSRTNNGSVAGEVKRIYANKFSGELLKIYFENDSSFMCTKEHVIFAVMHNKKIKSEDVKLVVNLGGGMDKFIHSYYFKDNIHDVFYTNDLDDIKKLTYEYKNGSEIYSRAQLGRSTMDAVEAKFLVPGALVFDLNGNLTKVIKVEKVSCQTTVHDIDIDLYHNYCVGGIMVHNSIYSFRGAKPENMDLFLKDYNAQIIKIEQNYRSDANILEAANAVIKNNKNRQGKNLVPTKQAKELIKVYNAFNDQAESDFIAHEIKQLRRTNIHYKEICILYRTNSQSRSLEKSLNASGIPYVVYGGFRFFDRLEVKHAMAYLRMVHNFKDNLAFIRIVNTPARAIGESAVKKLDAEALANGCSLFEMAQKSDPKTIKKFAPFVECINRLTLMCKGKNLKEMVKIIIEYSGLEQMYHDDKKEGPERLDNLYELISAAEVFMMENKNSSIDEFLAFSSLESDGEVKKRDDNADVVKMMSVHSSKGLEFEIVFLTGLEEQLFPHANSAGDPTAIEEERRLMYVAITRAKTKLYISFCEERLLHGMRQRFLRSRFLKELPIKLLTYLN